MTYDEHLHEIGAVSLRFSYTTIAPGAPLRETIHTYSVFANMASVDENSIYILPDNSAHLIFCLYDYNNRIVPMWTVVGPRSVHQIISRRNRLFTFICTFKPGGIKSQLNRPLDEISDLKADSSEVLRNYNPVIFEQLTIDAMCLDVPGFVNHLEAFLGKSVTPTHPVVKGFYERLLNENCGLKFVSKDLGYSDRQLRNLIQSNIGHSPKTVQQIERFARSLRLRKSNDNWACIAHSSGYYDQSHMIGDYQRLVGMSPEQLLC